MPGQVGKFICIGLNYTDHAAESGMPVPEESILLMKATSAICGPDDDIIIPRGSAKTDWEVELGVEIGREADHLLVIDDDVLLLRLKPSCANSIGASSWTQPRTWS